MVLFKAQIGHRFCYFRHSSAAIFHFFAANNLGPVAPLWFSSELDQEGRRELVHDDCALHHF